MDLTRKEDFVWNMTFCYRMMIASVDLLDQAIRCCKVEEERLLLYFMKHRTEEKDHDLMLLDDLKRLGVTDIPQHWEASQITGAQYYLIRTAHPAALLGYMHVLEENALSLKLVENLEAIHETELSCLRHHAVHDVGHAADLAKEIEALPEELQKLVTWNALHVAKSFKAAMLNHGAI